MLIRLRKYFYGGLFLLQSLHGLSSIDTLTVQTDIYARFYSFNENLPENTGIITDILQDHVGYMWFAGTQGLFRHDGSTTYAYKNEYAINGLPSNQIRCLEQDSMNRMFVGTTKGLSLFSYESDSFQDVFTCRDTACIEDTLSIRALLADGDSLLWVETLRGFLIKLDLQSLKVLKKYRHNPVVQSYYFYHSIYRDKSGVLWFAGRDTGPYYLDTLTDQLVHLPVSGDRGIPGGKHTAGASWFFEDSDNVFWIGAHDGVFHLDRRDNSLKAFFEPSAWTMQTDKKGDMWMHLGDGLATYNIKNKHLRIFKPNEEDAHALKGKYIYTLYIDTYGQIWISTEKGISVLYEDSHEIDYFFHIPGLESSLASSAVTTLKKAEDSRIWIGYDAKGLDLFDIQSEEIIHYSPENVAGMAGGNIREIAFATDNSIYCALWNGIGFGRLIQNKRTFELFALDSATTEMDWYNDLTFDSAGMLYLGFWGGKGLTQFDTASQSFVNFLTNKFTDPFSSRLITCLHFQNNDKLWMGTTSNGLHCYYPLTDTSESYYTKYNPEKGIDVKNIFDITEDIYGNIWVAAKGLYYIEKGAGAALNIPLPGLKYEPEIYHILADSSNNLWLLTNHGLLKYNVWQNNVTDYSDIIKISFSDGNATALQLSHEKIIVGGEGGLAIIYPENLNIKEKSPRLFLSSLYVFDTIKKPFIHEDQQITLNHRENFFSVKMGVNVLKNNNQFDYFYKLNGFHPDWQALDENTLMASFTNVPPGDYLFELKMRDNQGWTMAGREPIAISILPPYWNTLWFKTSVVIGILSLISLFYFLRTRSLKLSLANANLNLKLMRLQMNPHFIFNALFAIQSYLYGGKPETAGNYLADFARLVRLILQNNRNELVPIEDELETLELYIKMQQLRFANHINYHLHVDEKLKNRDLRVPPMLAQPFIENAIEHGIKTLKEKGLLIINYKDSGNETMVFSVEDNGIGFQASRDIKKAKSHESMATDICRKRLKFLSRKYKKNFHLEIEELTNNAGKPKGVRVTFKIPYEE